MVKKIGKMIRDLRKDKRISLRELAKEVGMSFVNLSYIENGRVQTSKEVLRKISKALDYDFDKLLSFTKHVDDDLISIINNRPDQVPDFLRIAKNLNSVEWEQLIKQVKKMNKDSNE